MNMVAVLLMSAKFTTLGLLKKKVIWNRAYYGLLSFHDVTIKILLLGSNYILDVVIRPKLDQTLALLWEKLL